MQQRFNAIELPKTRFSYPEIPKIRYGNLIVKFFGCREAHKVKECSKCEFWSNDNEHFEQCPIVQDQKEAAMLSKEYKSLLALDKIPLPAKVKLILFPELPVKEKGKSTGRPVSVKKLNFLDPTGFLDEEDEK
ncbi:MAG: hypothetical protein V1767_00820 [Chloroflexota bacterium]